MTVIDFAPHIRTAGFDLDVVMKDGFVECRESHDAVTRMRAWGEVDWCSHLEEFMKEYLDAPEWLLRSDEDWSGTIMVPVAPWYGIYAECRMIQAGITDTIEEKSATRIMWLRGASVSNQEAYEDLGRYMPGEGLMTWAEQIWELFSGLYLQEALDTGCTYSLHFNSLQSYNERVRNERVRTYETGRFAEAWSICYTGRCLNCNKMHTETLTDADLIPEVSQRGFPKAPTVTTATRKSTVDLITPLTATTDQKSGFSYRLQHDSQYGRRSPVYRWATNE